MPPARPQVVRRSRRAVALAAALLIGATQVSTASAALVAQPLAVTVSGFQDTVALSGLVNPTAVRFASDGRVFVAEKSGLIKVFSSLSATTPTVFADLRTNTHNFWDRGLLGLALDPGFPAQPYVYVLYTYDHILGSTTPAPRWGSVNVASDPCPSPPGPTADGCVVSGRLSRLTASGSVMTGPEQVLIEDWCQQYPSHSIGSIEFGPDGALYVSSGDGASFNGADWGQGGGTLPNTTSPVIPRNPCGDPPGGVGGDMPSPGAEGGSLRSQDIRTRSSGGGGGGGGSTGPYLTEVLADSPVVYYRLSETSGSSAVDASPNGRTGIYAGAYTANAASLLTTDTNAAITLTDGRVDLPATVNPWPGDFTLEAWAKPSQATAWAAVFSRETYQVSGLRLGQQGGQWGFWTTESGGSMEIVGGSVVAGQTYHIVGTRSGSTYRLYVNGAEVANGTGTLVTPTGGGRFGTVGGAPFKGVLDEAAVYPTALSAARIAAHYAAGQGSGPPPPTIADPVGLDGTILRVDAATGLSSAGNPLAGDSEENAERIIAYGLRNPFRIAFRPGTSELWVGDVGWVDWEEINRIVTPTSGLRNFGWPCYEGSGTLGPYSGLSMCQSLTSGSVVAPYYTYNHDDKVVAGETCPTGSSAITGLAFYQGGNYPAAYAGALFFTDHSRNCIWAMKAGTNGVPSTSNIETFVAAAANPVDLRIGPNGDLFYVDLEGGTIHRIVYLSGNQAPTASFTATPSSGPAPLNVAFDGRASSDPEGGALTYSWDLDGDGTYGDSTSATPNRTYTTSGTVTVRLRVTDPGGATGTTSRTIAVANDPPVPSIANPTALTTWKVGDTIAFSGSATDPQDGTLAASRLTWTLIQNHCPSNCHPHTVTSWVGQASGSFVAPDHEYPSNLELQLTATDSTGTSATISVVIEPQTVDLQIRSVPSGLQVTTGGFTAATPYTRTVILGSRNSVTTPTPQTLAGTSYTFDSWSDGGARTHDIIATAGGGTYTASFSAAPPATDYRSAVLADGPAAYYRLAETSGNSAADASPNGRTGSYTGTHTKGTAGLIAGDSNTAVTFTNGRVNVPSSVNPWAGAFTIEAWVKPSQTSAWAALFSQETYQANGLRLGQQGNRWGFWTTQSGGNVQIVGGTVVSGQTYHVVATRSGTTFRLYVNGVEIGNATGTMVAPAAGGRFGQVGGAPFKGVIDEAAIYPTALSAAQVAAHFTAGAP